MDMLEGNNDTMAKKN